MLRMPDADALQTEVLDVGGGPAGMFAALHATRFRAGRLADDLEHRQ